MHSRSRNRIMYFIGFNPPNAEMSDGDGHKTPEPANEPGSGFGDLNLSLISEGVGCMLLNSFCRLQSRTA